MSWASIATTSRIEVALPKSTSTRARLCSCARIRASTSITSVLTSSEARVEDSSSPTFSRALTASSKSAEGTRITSRERRRSSLPAVSSSVISPRSSSTIFCTVKRASPTSSVRSDTVAVEITARLATSVTTAVSTAVSTREREPPADSAPAAGAGSTSAGASRLSVLTLPPPESSDPAEQAATSRAGTVIAASREAARAAGRDRGFMCVGREPPDAGSPRAVWQAGRVRVLVVGAGLAGLTVAHDLTAAGHDVLVLEGSPHVGGKIRQQRVAGVSVDVGAEAMLNRRPEGVDLARSLGLEPVQPTQASSRIWTRGALRPLPRTLLGAPLDGDQLAASGVLGEEGLRRALAEVVTPVDGDPSVGDLVAARFGDEVTDRLVEPLLGGVYAGRAREISSRAAAPQLVALAERGSILEQAAALPVDGSPVFAGLDGGLGGLVAALVSALAAAGSEVRTGVQVREVRRTARGFVARFARTSTPGVGARTAPTSTGVGGPSSTNVGDEVTVDAVVLATPAAPTSRLLAGLAPVAAAELAGIDYASMAVVTLALGLHDAPDLAATDASGFLVPPVDGRRIKASTFSFAKWGWVRDAGAAEGVLHLRTSIGRLGEESHLHAGDDDLVARSLADLAEAVGLRATPVETHVQRWGGGLPQYRPGHLDLVARIRADVARVPGLAVCGAAYDGVGVAAVIASAHRAARDLGS